MLTITDLISIQCFVEQKLKKSLGFNMNAETNEWEIFEIGGLDNDV